MLPGHGFLGVSPEEYRKAAGIAGEVLHLAKNTLLIHLRFLDASINALEIRLHNEIAFATDGKCLYDTAFVFLDDDYRDLNVPPWAMKLVLSRDDVEGGRP